MPIVDEYILTNIDKPVSQLANALGISTYSVERIIANNDFAKQSGKPQVTDSKKKEMEALIYLINERETGWAVEVAINRLKFLDRER